MMLDPEFMEILNGSVTLMALWVLFFFGRYILMEWAGWRTRWRVAGAISIFTIFAGHFVLRGTVWVQRHLENVGRGLEWEVVAPVLAFGAVVLMVGSACVVRVFAPSGTGWRWAIIAVSTSVAAAVAVALSDVGRVLIE